jgi:hypothetical protein
MWSMNWVDLAKDGDTWRPHVNAVMIHQVPKLVWNFLTGEGPNYIIIVIYMKIHLILVAISVT